MTTVSDIFAFLETIAPFARKESWDNTGFQCGRADKEVNNVLIALDPFQAVADEAVRTGADLIITHHPILFFPTTAVTDGTPIGKALVTLLRHDIAAINLHTNLDVAPEGVSQVLADTLGLQEIQVIDPIGQDENGRDFGLLHKGTVPAQPLEDFLAHVKDVLHTPVLRYADGGKPVHCVAVGGGACASEFHEALRAGCDTFVTSDAKYNDFWDARDLGLTLIDAGHFYTENPVCEYLRARLAAAFPTVTFRISADHADCMKFF